MSSLNKIPEVDFSSWSMTATPRDLDDVTKGQKQCADEMFEALSTVGGFIMKNCDLNKEEVEDTITFLETFFHLPMEKKLKYQRNKEKFHGFFEPGEVRVNLNREADLNEAFLFQPQHMVDEDWPEKELPGGCKLVTEFMSKCFDQALKLVWIIALALNHTGDDLVTKGHSQQRGQCSLRFNFYAPIEENVGGDHMRMGEHTDYDMITLLMGRQLTGVQLQTKTGDWLDVMTEPGDILVIGGMLLGRWSAGDIRAPMHRVNAPDGEEKDKSRVSLPYFLHPEDDFVIRNIRDDPKYPPVPSLEYCKTIFNKSHNSNY